MKSFSKKLSKLSILQYTCISAIEELDCCYYLCYLPTTICYNVRFLKFRTNFQNHPLHPTPAATICNRPVPVWSKKSEICGISCLRGRHEPLLFCLWVRVLQKTIQIIYWSMRGWYWRRRAFNLYGNITGEVRSISITTATTLLSYF